MNSPHPQSNIFARRLARELLVEELDSVAGGIKTLIHNTGPYGGGEGSDTDAANDGNTY
jgi:hypothetical protein